MKNNVKKIGIIILVIALILVISMTMGTFLWYLNGTKPVSKQEGQTIRIEIAEGQRNSCHR